MASSWGGGGGYVEKEEEREEKREGRKEERGGEEERKETFESCIGEAIIFFKIPCLFPINEPLSPVVVVVVIDILLVW